jgi:hypothetical protein
MKVLAEKRQDQPRLAAYMPAKIIVPGKVSEAPCAIREMSPAGALLQIDPAWIFPKSFSLRIVGDTRLYRCTVKWREDVFIGVEFSSGRPSPFEIRVLPNQLPNRARMNCPPAAT